ncbi:transcriptional repressor NrdR [Patescibacteria group bacterium]|nr:transcriptional repressor NrdR [Patescibacteria group bacterium]
MHCPVCSFEDTKVVDSRITGEGAAIRRRRECESCGYRFSTNEEVELLDLVVVKRDGARQSYSREKIEHGLKKALEKRPVTDAAFRGLVHAIERDIQRKKTNELTSADVGEVVMNQLKSFDKVAYIRFASVYRQFEDIESFTRELEKLHSRAKKQKAKQASLRFTKS